MLSLAGGASETTGDEFFKKKKKEKKKEKEKGERKIRNSLCERSIQFNSMQIAINARQRGQRRTDACTFACKSLSWKCRYLHNVRTQVCFDKLYFHAYANKDPRAMIKRAFIARVTLLDLMGRRS